MMQDSVKATQKLSELPCFNSSITVLLYWKKIESHFET